MGCVQRDSNLNIPRLIQMPKYYQLPRSTPEAQGVSSTAITAFIDAVEKKKIELHSMMLLRHGHVVAEGWWAPYSPERIHHLYSLSKSFTSTAIGMAISEGLLSVDDQVLSFFPDKRPPDVNKHLENIRVHHLLSMSTGHWDDAIERARQVGDSDWIAGFLSVPPDQAPGTVFTYNNAATFMLSAILQTLTDMKLAEYLVPRLFEPLGITQAYWYENPQGINLGFSGLHITTDAIARFGQLYLQKGQWDGRQLISKGWVETATSMQIPTNPPPEDETPDWDQGYGYQFWQSRHNTYRADGAFGQFCLIMPEQDTVLAITAGFDNMQSILDQVWMNLLLAMKDGELDENRVAHDQLSEQLGHLTIQPTQAEKTSPIASSVSGKKYDFKADPNAEDVEYMTLHFHKDHADLIAKDDRGEHRIQCGYNQWLFGKTTFYDSEEVPVVSSGAWTSTDVFSLEIRYLQTPHCLTLDFHYDGEYLQVGAHWNVILGPTELPTIHGHYSR